MKVLVLFTNVDLKRDSDEVPKEDASTRPARPFTVRSTPPTLRAATDWG
jgi:hypothetical protein